MKVAEYGDVVGETSIVDPPVVLTLTAKDAINLRTFLHAKGATNKIDSTEFSVWATLDDLYPANT